MNPDIRSSLGIRIHASLVPVHICILGYKAYVHTPYLFCWDRCSHALSGLSKQIPTPYIGLFSFGQCSHVLSVLLDNVHKSYLFCWTMFTRPICSVGQCSQVLSVLLDNVHTSYLFCWTMFTRPICSVGQCSHVLSVLLDNAHKYYLFCWEIWSVSEGQRHPCLRSLKTKPVWINTRRP